jgi:hypothetical protein
MCGIVVDRDEGTVNAVGEAERNPRAVLVADAAEVAKKRALVGTAALVLNPLRLDPDSGGQVDVPDDTAQIATCLRRVQEHFGSLSAVMDLSRESMEASEYVADTLALINQRMAEQWN